MTEVYEMAVLVRVIEKHGVAKDDVVPFFSELFVTYQEFENKEISLNFVQRVME